MSSKWPNVDSSMTLWPLYTDPSKHKVFAGVFTFSEGRLTSSHFGRPWFSACIFTPRASVFVPLPVLIFDTDTVRQKGNICAAAGWPWLYQMTLERCYHRCPNMTPSGSETGRDRTPGLMVSLTSRSLIHVVCCRYWTDIQSNWIKTALIFTGSAFYWFWISSLDGN